MTDKDTLMNLIDAYAETRHRCGGIYNAKTEAARKAVVEALSGVQALSAAPAEIPSTKGAMWFTKKPVTIQAIQWTGGNLREVITFTDGPPDTRSHHAGMAWDEYRDLVARDGLKIYTLEGEMIASPGDWIIRGVKGEFYPCKPDIFQATYTAASPTPPAEQQAASSAVLKAIREANMQLVRTGDDAFMLVPYKLATAEQAAPKAAPGDALDEVMRERDDAEDFINELLDEVLGADRPEWSSAYNRYDAMSDVRERITALHKPAVDKAWGQFQSAMAAPQQEAQEPVALHQVYRCKIKSRKQIDKEIPRESQGWWADVAAGQKLLLRQAVQSDLDRCILGGKRSKDPNDYMCETQTNGSLVSKVALEYMNPEQNVFASTAPQPAPAPLSDDVVKDAARWRMVALIGNEVMLHPEKRTQAAAVKAYMDATHSGLDLTGAVDAAIAAQGGK